MRRKDREVTDQKEIMEILAACKTCHLAMVEDNKPYVIPLSYGYEFDGEALTLYFHSAKEGRKIDILKKNNEVCFEISMEGEPIYAKETPCNSGYYFSCVHGFGKVEFMEMAEDKCDALTKIVKQQAGFSPEFKKEQAESVCVYKVVTTDFTGKKKPRQERK